MKNLYTVEEIDQIFKNCNSVDELFIACDALKRTREEGNMSNNISKIVGKLSLLRFTELTAKT